MKSLDTLVEDIYGLFKSNSDTKPTERDVEVFGVQVSKLIRDRLLERKVPDKLRLSNIGTPCDRKLWYTINTPELSEELSPPTRIKFLFGDIIEELVLFLTRVAGHKVVGEQDTLIIGGVVGHRDAVIDGVTVDIKSASSNSFEKFSKHTLRDSDPFGYIDQLGAYLYAGHDDPLVTEKDIAAFIAVDKQHGKIAVDKHPKTDINYEELIAAKQRTISLRSPPPRAFEQIADGKSGNLKLGVTCSYCSFKHECWGTVRTFLYANGPRFLTHVKREPEPHITEVDRDGNFISRSAI